MSDSITVYVQGEKAIVSAMKDVLIRYKVGIDQAVQGAGIDTEALAKQACPVDTGRLRASIHYEKTAEMECTVGTNVNYGPYVENGHVTRAGTHVPAHPFLYPAFLRTTRALQEELKALLA